MSSRSNSKCFTGCHGKARSELNALSAKQEQQKTDIGEGELVPVVGFELTTYRLQGGCSTN